MLTVDSTLSASSTSVRDRLQRRLRGSVWLPADAGYAAATAAWNLNARHRPALAVMADDAADVATAVQVRGSRPASGSACWPPGTAPAGPATAAC